APHAVWCARWPAGRDCGTFPGPGRGRRSGDHLRMVGAGRYCRSPVDRRAGATVCPDLIQVLNENLPCVSPCSTFAFTPTMLRALLGPERLADLQAGEGS